VEFWLWLYVAVMAAAVALFRYWRANPKGIPPIEYTIATAIPLWSGFWHLVMAVGGGRTDLADRTIFWTRYADWVVTTPLLLVALSLTATHALPDKRWGLVRMLVAVDIVMITSGFLADLMESQVGRYGLYAVGVLAMLVVFGLIWGPLRATAARQPGPMSRSYTQVAALLSVLWVGYPLIWILGPSGFEWFGDTTDTALLVIMSILSKAGWSTVDLGLLRRLSDRHLVTVA
jgi:bacteriorhodopsin